MRVGCGTTITRASQFLIQNAHITPFGFLEGETIRLRGVAVIDRLVVFPRADSL